MGEPPWRVDILQTISGVTFEEAWPHRSHAFVNGWFEVPLISADDLIKNKLTAGRPQDVVDAGEMQRKNRLLRRFED